MANGLRSSRSVLHRFEPIEVGVLRSASWLRAAARITLSSNSRYSRPWPGDPGQLGLPVPQSTL